MRKIIRTKNGEYKYENKKTEYHTLKLTTLQVKALGNLMSWVVPHEDYFGSKAEQNSVRQIDNKLLKLKQYGIHNII